MANDLTTFNREHWAAEMQATYSKELVARALVTESLRNQLVDGTKINKPYRGSLFVTDYVKGTDITSYNDLGGTNEYLEIDTTKIVPFYVDYIDKIENMWDMEAIYAADAQRALNNKIDQAILAEYSNAATYVSAQDLGGSGTGAATVSTANIDNLFAVAGRNLDRYNRGQQSRFAVVGPRLKEILKLAVGSRETGFGDTVGANGLIGSRFGFDIHYSNNIPFSCTLTTSSIPVDGETITIDGVVFTWEATGTACSTAGEVDIKVSEDTAYANLVVAINASAAASTSTYCDVSADDRETLRNHGITASYTAHALVISGYGDVVISEATTNCAVTSNIQYPLFGVKGAIDLVIEKETSVDFVRDPDRLGTNVFAWVRYGKKTFTKEKKSIVYGKVDTSSWV
jgi:hypothetical protein